MAIIYVARAHMHLSVLICDLLCFRVRHIQNAEAIQRCLEIVHQLEIELSVLGGVSQIYMQQFSLSTLADVGRRLGRTIVYDVRSAR